MRAARLVCLVITVIAASPLAAQRLSPQPAALKLQVVRTYPHDPQAFTQGLIWRDGILYESTGLVGRSSLRKVDLSTGQVKQQVAVAPPYFAEGLADVGNRLFQLTWQHGQVFVYDKATLNRVGEHRYDGEGWGLCHDGQALVMSNGSDTLTIRDPKSFAATRSVKVTQAGRPLGNLNELECVGPDVYANVWMTDQIVRINPKTGEVSARIDASGLLTPAERLGVDVLNGIAYDPADQTFLITGKNWPKLFRVRFVPAAP